MHTGSFTQDVKFSLLAGELITVTPTPLQPPAVFVDPPNWTAVSFFSGKISTIYQIDVGKSFLLGP